MLAKLVRGRRIELRSSVWQTGAQPIGQPRMVRGRGVEPRHSVWKTDMHPPTSTTHYFRSERQDSNLRLPEPSIACPDGNSPSTTINTFKPLTHISHYLVPPHGIEPQPSVLQTDAHTRYAREANWLPSVDSNHADRINSPTLSPRERDGKI